MSNVISLKDYLSKRLDQLKDDNYKAPQPLYWTDTMAGGFMIGDHELVYPLSIYLDSDGSAGPKLDCDYSIKTHIGQCNIVKYGVYNKPPPHEWLPHAANVQVNTAISTDCSFTLQFKGYEGNPPTSDDYWGVLNFRACDGKICYYKNTDYFPGMKNINIMVFFVPPGGSKREWAPGENIPLSACNQARAVYGGLTMPRVSIRFGKS